MSLGLERIFESDGDSGLLVARNFERLDAAVNQPVPQARVFNSVAIATANVTGKTLTFDSERWDNGSMHSVAVNTSRLTAPITGLYSIGASVQFQVAAGGYRQVWFVVNGATIVGLITATPNAAAALVMNPTIEWQLAAGDYVEVLVFQNSGGALNIELGASYSPDFWMSRLAGYTNLGVES